MNDVLTSATALHQQKRSRVLLAEDSDLIAYIAKLELARLELDLDRVPDGASAVDAFRKSPYDMVLMDVQMPFLDGLQATVEIRAIERSTARPAVLIVGVSSSSNLALCLNSGMDDLVRKPAKYDLVVQKWLPTCKARSA